MNPLLVADCVTKSFRGRRVLSAGSLRAVPGEIRALLGLNGAGKSTLLKIAAGWMQPDSGSVQFDGEAYLTARLPALAGKGLFYVPDRDLFSSAFTVRSQLEMIRRQFDGGDIESAANAAGLVVSLLDRRVHELSGGERRRLEIAAILVRRPRCLLTDEPFRGVAPKDAEVMTRVLRDLAAGGMAIVVSGQEVPALLAAADHVTWCTAGTTYELGPPAKAVQHESFRREYLGRTHYTRAV